MSLNKCDTLHLYHLYYPFVLTCVCLFVSLSAGILGRGGWSFYFKVDQDSDTGIINLSTGAISPDPNIDMAD